MLESYPEHNPIVLYDGVCNFCSTTVQFVLKHDPKEHFLFAALQSKTGQDILKAYNMPQTDFDTFVLLEKGKIYTKSTAALKLMKRLNGLWPMLYGFIIIPAFIRDAVYSLIARNRYKWFGKKDSCMIPDPKVRSRFLDIE